MPVRLTDSIRFLVTCALWLTLAQSSEGADFTQPEPLEPDVAARSSEGEEAMAAIRLPAGWRIQLFASEPDIANIVAFDIDNRGRIFACESFRQNRGVTDNRAHDDVWLLADLAAETVQDRIDYHKRLLGEAAITYAQHDDRIRRLEDSDGDGVADRSYVVANGFNAIEEGTGAGVLVRGNQVYYTCIPKLWSLADNNDDGNADERIVLSDGFGVRVAFRGHDLHGLVIGPDGRLYFSIGDRGYHVTTNDGRLLADPASGAVFRCELDGSGLEVFATGLRNPQELAFNDVGDLFTVDNNSDSGDMARIVHLVEGSDSGWRMYYQYLPDRGPFNRERIWEPFHDEQAAYIVPPVANLTDGPSGLAYYPGTGFGDSLNDTFLVCDFRGGPANSGIRSFQVEEQGAFYRLAQDSDPIWTVLATDVAFGPDGALYISDWVDGWDGLGKGRIYRVTDPNHRNTPLIKEVEQLLKSDWAGRTTEQLSDNLSHTDRRIRFEAQWELARRGDTETLVDVANDGSAQTLARLHAVWGADQLARLEPEQTDKVLASLRGLLSDLNPVIRAAMTKVIGERGDATAVERLRELLDDDSARVRYFAIEALGKLKDAKSFSAVVELLAANKNRDPVIRHAGVRYLAALEDIAKLARLRSHPNESVRRAAVVALRRLQSQELTHFLSDDSPLVVLEAARAIHDQPIPVAMNALAAMIDNVSDDPPLVRRVLNANYRLGDSQSAIKVGEFAGRTSASPEMRIEALDMLAAWAKPDPRDRVLNDYRPLPERDRHDAAAALEPHIDTLMTSEASVRDKAIEAAAGLGIKKISPMLVKRVNDPGLEAAVRAKSLQALSQLDRARSVALARKIPLLPATELLPAALTVLARHDADKSMPKFVNATDSRSAGVRQLAWDILARSKKSPLATKKIVAGVRSYLDGSLPADVHLNVLEAAAGRIDADLQQSLAEHAQALAQADPLAAWLPALQGGDVVAGRRLFFENTNLSCVRCHKVDRAGGEVGPDLTLIGKQKDRRYLLEAICLPNAQIAKGFETAVVVNDSGQMFTGIVKEDNDDFVELIQNDGSHKRIPAEEIVGQKKGNSSMPDDLIKALSTRQLRDLVAYLASLQIDPRDDDDEIE